jgi:hypothetical protein
MPESKELRIPESNHLIVEKELFSPYNIGTNVTIKSWLQPSLIIKLDLEIINIDMTNKSSVFKKHYEFYRQQIKDISLEDIADHLDVEFIENKMIIPFLGHSYKISRNGIFDQFGKTPLYPICVVLFKYILTNPKITFLESPWTSYKDFKDSGPLIGFFSNDVEKAIVKQFSGKTEDLKSACESLGGKNADMDISYDVSMQLTALPKIPMILLFNDADDEFPARCSVLFQKRIENYLDMETVALIGNIFAKMLIAIDKGELYG